MLPNYQARSPFVLKHTTSLYIFWTYVCHFVLWPTVFLYLLPVRPRPKLHWTESSGLATITRITLEIELFTALNSFAGAVNTQKLMGALFLFELVAICHSYKPYSTAFTWKFIVHLTNYEGKSCVGMFSCVKVLCVTTTIKNITKKTLNNVTWLLLLFQFKQ